jgi:hypothetical protein
MKKRTLIIVAIVLLASGIFAAQMTMIRADGVSKTGSSEDPLVTKSYVDQLLSGKAPSQTQTNGTVNNASSSPSLTEITKLINDEVTKRLANQGSSTSNPTGSPTSSITIVNLTNSQTLFAGEGAEFIVRTGKVNIVSTDGDGVPDVTAGKDLQPNAPVELNHLLVFPREGRGIKPDAKNVGDIYVMIRGNYLLVDNDKK